MLDAHDDGDIRWKLHKIIYLHFYFPFFSLDPLFFFQFEYFFYFFVHVTHKGDPVLRISS